MIGEGEAESGELVLKDLRPPAGEVPAELRLPLADLEGLKGRLA